jgi:hypothetical protein
MKKLIGLIGICVSSASWTTAAVMPADTVILADDKRIELREEDDRLKVKIYDISGNGELHEREAVFEGHYGGGKSYERRKRSIHLTLPVWKSGFDPHWAGFGMGFINVSDESLHINDIEGVSVRSANSLEYNLNVIKKSFLLARQSNFAVVTGAGIRWSRYHIRGDRFFQETDGRTQLHPAPEGVTLSKNKLNITSVTIPLLLEWQNRANRRDEKFFFSAGLVGVIKTASSSRIEYRDAFGKKQKEKVDTGMNLRPVSMDVLVQAGYNWVGLYARYSPFGLFESGKGPKVHPVSIGLQLYW